jgi:lipopolysaccharide/colanic/teichoic acid biosynthesis glycosyltransferase
MIILLSPLFLLSAILVLLDDGAPIFYKQERVGQFGKHFIFVKFRTMRCNADKLREELIKSSGHKSPTFKLKCDPRMTRVGKWLRRSSLDELPQLWDVIVGRMSIVGPRPHLPEEVCHYRDDQWARLFVKPGLFCLREVSGRSELTFDQWMRMDIDYVRNQNFGLDLVIMLKVIPAVLSARGAY